MIALPCAAISTPMPPYWRSLLLARGHRFRDCPVLHIGYVNVSTGEQILNLQCHSLTATGCDTIYLETAIRTEADVPVLEKGLSYLHSGATLVVWSLDQLGRSLEPLIDVVAGRAERDIGFKVHLGADRRDHLWWQVELSRFRRAG